MGPTDPGLIYNSPYHSLHGMVEEEQKLTASLPSFFPCCRRTHSGQPTWLEGIAINEHVVFHPGCSPPALFDCSMVIVFEKVGQALGVRVIGVCKKVANPWRLKSKKKKKIPRAWFPHINLKNFSKFFEFFF